LDTGTAHCRGGNCGGGGGTTFLEVRGGFMPFLFSILILIIVMGLVYWVITMLPLPEPFKTIAIVVVLLICLIYLLSMLFGMAAPFPVFRGGYR
jgi:hypothetical protein